MSSHQNVYLGPYVACTYRSEKREEDRYGCTKPACMGYGVRTDSEHGWGKFCPNCGGPIGMSKEMVASRPDPEDVVGNLFGLMTNEDDEEDKSDEFFLAPYHEKKRSPPRAPMHFDETEIGHFDLETVDRQAEMKWLEDQYAASIAKLRDVYDNVRIGWGLHIYYE